jgi:hypothetical protein
MSKVEQHSSGTLSLIDECCSTFDFECTWWMLFYFGHWVYLMNVVLLWTLSVPDECCSTLDIECTWWMLFYFWLWVYLMNVVLLLTLSVSNECCSTFDWVYLMNVVLLWTLSVPDECCSTFDFEFTWWMLLCFWLWVYLMNVFLLLTEFTRWMFKVEQHSSGTLKVQSRTTFIRYTQSPK